MSKRKTTEEFIKQAKEIHGDKYDYSKVEYKNNSTPVCIICPEHGEFWQRPNSHLKGNGCDACGGTKKLTTEEFIKRSKEIHGDKYDYSKVEYVDYETPVCIICPEHGEFWQIPHTHLSKRNSGCPKCRYVKSWNTRGRITTEEFIEKAKSVHGDKYNYSKVVYKNIRTKVCITCPEHGDFFQLPKHHVSRKHGCPICSESHLEKELRIFLEENSIKYNYEMHFDELKQKSFDFYLPEFKIAIECQGIQHFEPIGFFGGEEVLKKQQESDFQKKEYCDKNGIKIVYVTDRNLLKYGKFLMTIAQCETFLILFKKSLLDS